MLDRGGWHVSVVDNGPSRVNAVASVGPLDAISLQTAARSAWTDCKYDLALELLDAAREAFEAEGNTLAALRTQLGRCNVQIDMGCNVQAITTALRLRQRLDSTDVDELNPDDRKMHQWLQAAAVENYGAALEVASRHTEAAEVLHLSLSLYEQAGSDIDRARVRASLGVQLLYIGSLDLAIEELGAARHTFLENEDHWLGYRCLVYESRALAIGGRYAEALDRLAEADALVAAYANDNVTADVLRGRLARAEVHLELNMLPEALVACEALLPVLKAKSLPPEIAACRHIEARARLAAGDHEGATLACAQAIDIWNGAGLDVRAARAAMTLARCLDTTTDRRAIDDAIEVLRGARERHGVASAALVGAHLASKEEPADTEEQSRYLDLAVEFGALDSPETAWRERWQRSLLASSSDARSAFLDESLAILHGLQGGLDDEFQRAPFMATRRDPLEARVELCLAQDNYDEAFALSASYRAAALGPSEPASLPVVHSTTLFYQSVGDRLICFVATPDDENGTGTPGVAVVDLGLILQTVDELKIDLEAHWRHVMNPRLRSRLGIQMDPVKRTLQELYNAIFASVEQLLPDGPLVIVPTGRIAGIPFAALHDGTSYLVDRFAVSMSPGLGRSDRLTHPSPVDIEPGKTLVVGLPDRLAPAVEAESRHVATATAGRLLLREAATAEATQAALPETSLVHLAGHSHFRSDNPWLSWFQFFDRQVTATELAGWNLTSKTVILSSCSSATQLNLGEDELLGLPRALVMAGATDVVVNLWPVDDQTSSEFMTELYSELPGGVPQQALRTAQQRTRSRYPHPYFWASTIHYQSPRL